MILVPAIDILGGKAVRLKKGDYDQVTVYNEDAVAQARAFQLGLGPLPEDTAQTENGGLSTCICSGSMELRIRLDGTGRLEQWSCAALWQPEEHWQLWQ